ncbi:MAG: AraC family transcriptional regulator [Bacteroidota bacterium]
MHVFHQSTKPEQQQVLLKVLHYINENLTGDVSLETLADIANYSPFHFQKMFSEAISESPKQYIIRLKLEKAAHFIKLFPTMAISEISVVCGFSYNSIFSRAFKNYYGVSAETYRELPPKNLHLIKKKKEKMAHWEDIPWVKPITDIQENLEQVKILNPPQVITHYPFRIACIQTTLSHKENIYFAFKSLLQWAYPVGLITASTKYYGVWLDFPLITPAGKCRFLCGIEYNSDAKVGKGISLINFNKGQYVNHQISGSINNTLDALIVLNHHHLDNMGYCITEMICYEQFAMNPAEVSYDKNQRTILIPVKKK